MFCCPYFSQLSTILNNILEPKSSAAILFNIVDNYRQYGRRNIVQAGSHEYANKLIMAQLWPPCLSYTNLFTKHSYNIRGVLSVGSSCVQ